MGYSFKKEVSCFSKVARKSIGISDTLYIFVYVFTFHEKIWFTIYGELVLLYYYLLYFGFYYQICINKLKEASYIMITSLYSTKIPTYYYFAVYNKS